MKRKKSNSFFVTSLILAFNFSCAQILVSQELESFIIPDTLFPKNAASCGISHDYIKSLKVGDVTNIPKTAPISFPSYAVINCGKFDIYYEDLISENPEVGFADQINGQARRNTLCAVLTYIQSVFDFSNIPSNNPIRLHVNESFAPAVNPAPSDAEYLAFAGSTYNLASSQITNGFVFDYTTTGTDPANINQYHANLTVNFDQTESGGIIQWQDDYTILPISNCFYDLFSVLLHEIGHTLGWFSFIKHSVAGTPESINQNDQYSGLDVSLHVHPNTYPLQGLIPLVVNAPGSPSINPLFQSDQNVLTDNKIWLNELEAPNNDPVYSGLLFTYAGSILHINSILSHLDDQWLTYTERSRISPGEAKNYVMGPYSIKGEPRRSFQDIEINTLLELGYVLNPGYSSITLTNSPPHSTRMAGYVGYFDNYFPETVSADFPPLVNDAGAYIDLILENDPTLVDLEGDPIYVSPGTLVNIRGCGIGGNNHNALTTTTDIEGNIIAIRYTPRPNFYGRAQFGFRLFDGKEEGSYVIYTIDVLKGNNVSCAAGSNIVLNGDFEEGTEVKRLGAEELIDASTQYRVLKEGKLRGGIHFGDCHPYNYMSNNYVPYGAGDLISDSYIDCNGSSYTSIAGSPTSTFPIDLVTYQIPTSFNEEGQRFRRITNAGALFNLCTETEKCKKYILEFDYYFVQVNSISSGTNIPLVVGFTNTVSFPVTSFTFNFTHDLIANPGNWQHISIPFTYCGDLPATILYLRSTLNLPGVLIDNLELMEDLTPQPPLSVNITPSQPEICVGNSVALSTEVNNALCNVTYDWSPASGLSCTNCANPDASPNTTTTYNLTVNDECSSVTEQVTITVNPLPSLTVSAYPLTICSGDSTTLTATGATEYTWNPGDFSGNPYLVSPTENTTYTVNGTDANGCTATETFNVTISNEIAINFNSLSPCTYNEGFLTAIPSNGLAPYSYLWNTGSTESGIYGLIEGTYSVTVEDANGCTATASSTITNQVQTSHFDYPNGLVITSPSQQIEDLNEDGVVRIRGTLVFKSNVQYTFGNKTIEFARDLEPESIDQGHTHSGMIVEPGAKVTANNVTFKGLLICDNMWDGIQVWGDDFAKLVSNKKNFLALNINSLKNGTLYLNNCTVRDAHIGVALYRVNMPFIIQPKDHGRGLLHAVSTHFINNNVSVDFFSRSNFVNNSTIKMCSFTCNQLLLDQVQYNGKGSDVFIRLQGVRNPLIAGNNFNGNTSFDVGDRGTGIRSYGAGYKVQSGNVGQISPNSPPQPNIFNNLDQGIDIYSFGGAANTIRIKDNRFNNVYQGVTANGSNFDEISYNIFNIPAGDIDFNSWGIFLQTSSGFLATENTFNTTGSNQYTFGAVARDVNLMNGELYKNRFNGNFNSATQAEGIANNQLQIDCNRYLGNNVFDWTVFSDNIADQGVCLPDATAPATNIFSECITADESNIFSIANFEYASQDQFKPDCSSLTILIDECQLTDSYANACPQLVSYPCPQCIVALGQQFDFTPPGLERNKIKGELIRRLAQEGDVQQLVNILTSEALPEDKKIIIPTRIKRKEYIEAREVLDSLEQITFEDQKFVELFDVLITLGETERELDELTASELSVIEGVAYSGTEVAVQAEAVLAELNKTRYIRFPQGFPTNTAMMMVTNESETTTTTFMEQINVSVYPNPSEGDVIVKFEEAKNASGYLIDAMGKIVKNFTFIETESVYEIRGLARGLYTLGIHYTDGTSDSKRILIK